MNKLRYIPGDLVYQKMMKGIGILGLYLHLI